MRAPAHRPPAPHTPHAPHTHVDSKCVRAQPECRHCSPRSHLEDGHLWVTCGLHGGRLRPHAGHVRVVTWGGTCGSHLADREHDRPHRRAHHTFVVVPQLERLVKERKLNLRTARRPSDRARGVRTDSATERRDAAGTRGRRARTAARGGATGARRARGRVATRRSEGDGAGGWGWHANSADSAGWHGRRERRERRARVGAGRRAGRRGAARASCGARWQREGRVAHPAGGGRRDEELDAVDVEAEGDGLEEGDVVGEQLLVRQVERVRDQLVDVVVGQDVEDRRARLDVLKQDRERLQQLDLRRPRGRRTEDSGRPRARGEREKITMRRLVRVRVARRQALHECASRRRTFTATGERCCAKRQRMESTFFSRKYSKNCGSLRSPHTSCSVSCRSCSTTASLFLSVTTVVLARWVHSELRTAIEYLFALLAWPNSLSNREDELRARDIGHGGSAQAASCRR
eukprot:6044606-Prymnesium_polylepis.1